MLWWQGMSSELLTAYLENCKEFAKSDMGYKSMYKTWLDFCILEINWKIKI